MKATPLLRCEGGEEGVIKYFRRQFSPSLFSPMASPIVRELVCPIFASAANSFTDSRTRVSNFHPGKGTNSFPRTSEL